MSRNQKEQSLGSALSLLICASISLGLQRCGVEAGNPTTTTKKGTLSLILTKTTTTTGESMVLSLNSVGLTSLSDSSLTTTSLPLSSNSIELFSRDDSSSETLIQTEMQAGTYDQVVMTLPTDKVGHYVDDTGQGKDVLPDGVGGNVFYFSDTIEIKGSETTEVRINLDPRRSIFADGDNRRFKPIGNMAPGRFNTRYDGVAPNGALTACVYHFNAQRPNRLHLDSEPRSKVEPVGIYATRADIQFDSTSLCSNAFRRIVVRDQKFGIFGVPPGDYAVRFFTASGFIDGSDFKVDLPQ